MLGSRRLLIVLAVGSAAFAGCGAGSDATPAVTTPAVTTSPISDAEITQLEAQLDDIDALLAGLEDDLRRD